MSHAIPSCDNLAAMAKYLHSSCPAVMDTSASSCVNLDATTPLQAVNGQCVRCSYRFTWIVIRGGSSLVRCFYGVKTKHTNLFGIVIAIACFLFFSSEVVAQQQDWLPYYPAVSRLQGRLIKVFKYGKPSYGENPERDEKVEVPILILQTPVRLKARSTSSVNNESVTNVSFVQLSFPPEVDGNYSKHLDKDIIVAGTLVRGYKGEHFTEVVMIVKAVNPTGKPM
jgi:hypothetical protein